MKGFIFCIFASIIMPHVVRADDATAQLVMKMGFEKFSPERKFCTNASFILGYSFLHNPKIWTFDGRLIDSFASDSVYTAADCHSNGRYIYYSTEKSFMQHDIFESSEKEIFAAKPWNGNHDFAIIPGSDSMLVTTYGGKIGILDLKSLQYREFGTTEMAFGKMTVSPLGDRVVIHSLNSNAELFSLPDGKKIATLGGLFSGHSKDIDNAVFTIDGKIIYTASHAEIFSWTADGEKIRKYDYRARFISLTQAGDLIITHWYDGEISKIRPDGGEIQKWKLPATGVGDIDAAFENPNTGTITVLAGRKVYELFDDGRQQPLEHDNRLIQRTCLSEGGKEILFFAGNPTTPLVSHLLTDGRWLEKTSAACMQSGQVPLIKSYGEIIEVYEPARKTLLWTQRAKEGRYVSSAFFRNSEVLSITFSSGITNFYAYPKMNRLASVAFAAHDNLVVGGADGRFDSLGDVSSMAHWLAGSVSVDMKMLAEKYRTPGLLAELLTGKPVAGRKAMPKLPPSENIAQQLIGKVWQIKSGGEIDVYISGAHTYKAGGILRVLSGKKFIPIKIKQSYHTKVTCSGSGAIAKGMPVFK